jgi:hypothetical protein
LKAGETFKEAILSPVRLPFRHTGVNCGRSYTKARQSRKRPIVRHDNVTIFAFAATLRVVKLRACFGR